MKGSLREHTGIDSVHLDLGPVDVCIRSDMPGVAEDLAELHGHRFRATTAGGGPIRVEVRKTGRRGLWGGRYGIWGDDEEIFADCRPCEVLACADWAINHRIIARCTRYLQIHGAVLAWRGQGFLFAGRSGSGKSTLAAGLVARGWEYLSDEFLLLDPDTLCAQPLPKAVCLKAGSFPLIRRLGLPFWTNRSCEKGRKGRVGYVPASHAVGDREPVARPIRAVCLTSCTAGAKPRAASVSPAETVFELSRCVFNRGDFGVRTTALMARVVRAAACFRLEGGDLRATCDLVESLLDHAACRTH